MCLFTRHKKEHCLSLSRHAILFNSNLDVSSGSFGKVKSPRQHHVICQELVQLVMSDSSNSQLTFLLKTNQNTKPIGLDLYLELWH